MTTVNFANVLQIVIEVNHKSDYQSELQEELRGIKRNNRIVNFGKPEHN